MSELFFTLGNAAIGTIDPHENQQERLEEFTIRTVSGEFHKTVADVVPARCVDGRSPSAAPPLAPNAAGGSESLFVADDLTVKKFAASDATTLSGYMNMLNATLQAGYEIGGHTDTHASGEKSGCGANDRLPEIYQYIASQAHILRDMAAKLGVEVSDDTHELILRNATFRKEFSKGSELFTYLSNTAKEPYIDVLEGEHNEVAVVINTRKGTTLDRSALRSEFGDMYQAFNVDVWAFDKAASIGSESADETAQKFAAMIYYNLATAMVLAGPMLRVIVLL